MCYYAHRHPLIQPGHSFAQVKVAKMNYDGKEVPVDNAKAAYYLTLAYCKNPDLRAGYMLGYFFYHGLGGLDKSPYRARYYLEEAASKGNKNAFTSLALTLMEIDKIRYNSSTSCLPGHNSMPRCLFWARKAAACGDPRAIQVVAQGERMFQQSCANCKKRPDSVTGKLKGCARCKAVWYCGKDCQVKHWKDGHKINCVKQG